MSGERERASFPLLVKNAGAARLFSLPSTSSLSNNRTAQESRHCHYSHTIRVQVGAQWFVCSVLNVSPHIRSAERFPRVNTSLPPDCIPHLETLNVSSLAIE